MRSTGEVLGMADSFGLAFYKAQDAAQGRLPVTGHGPADNRRPRQGRPGRGGPAVRRPGLYAQGDERHAGIPEPKHGIEAERVFKMHEQRPHIADLVTNREIHLVINTPRGKASKADDSYIRKAAIRYKVPYITTMAAARAAAKGIAANESSINPRSNPSRQYHAGIK